jgi:hypothetical protein
MNVTTKQIYCSHCKEMRMGQRARVNHILHVIIFFIVSAVTCGWGGIIWFFVWLIDAYIKSTKPYQCPICGTPESIKKTDINNPFDKSDDISLQYNDIQDNKMSDKNLIFYGCIVVISLIIILFVAAICSGH